MPPIAGAIVGIGTAVASVATPVIAAYQGYKAIEGIFNPPKAPSYMPQTYEASAGEYIELNREQMQMQMGMQYIDTLSNLITSRQQQSSQMMVLPAAKERSTIEQLNQAIDRLFRG